jgi:UrcA family protein
MLPFPNFYHQEIFMKTTIKTRFQSTASILAIVVLGCAASTGRAIADQPGEILTQKVSYGDLDLESEQGAKLLYGRLQLAARDVCAPLEGIDLNSQALRRNCLDSALNLAVSKVNKPLVSALQAQNVNGGGKS